MSTPEQDLLRYEREQARLDAEDAAREDEDQPLSCDYCGAWIEAGDEHVVKNGANLWLDGPECDTLMCPKCFAEADAE